MSYHIYTTDAFVLDWRTRGEADRIFYLYTRELGLIRAIATGIRLGKSKLASHIDKYSYISVSIVRGKEVWRITDTRKYDFFRFDENKELRRVYVKFLSLIKRMVQGESSDTKLFDSIVAALNYIENDSNTSYRPDTSLFEALLLLRVLRRLGYIKKIPNLEMFISEDATLDVYDDKTLKDFAQHKREAVKEINSTLKESHL